MAGQEKINASAVTNVGVVEWEEASDTGVIFTTLVIV
jgi:hypothetical protein